MPLPPSTKNIVSHQSCHQKDAKASRAGTARVERAHIAAACGVGAQGRAAMRQRATMHFSRFRVDSMHGLRAPQRLHARQPPLEARAVLSSFTNDFWVAGRPALLATWSNISTNFEWYIGRLSAKGITQAGTHAAHYLWPVHIQEALRLFKVVITHTHTHRCRP